MSNKLQDAINRIKQVERDALAKMERIATGQIASHNRVSDIKGIKREASREISAIFTEALKTFPAERAELEAQANAIGHPSGEELAQIEYFAKRLLARAATTPRAKLEAEWQAALQRGDKVTARAFLDNIGDVFKFEGLKGGERDRALIEARYATEVKATRALIETADQKAARERLAAADAARVELVATEKAARQTLEGARFNGRGLTVPPPPAERTDAPQNEDESREMAWRATNRYFGF